MDIIGLSQRKEEVTRVMALLRAEVGEEEAEFSLEAAEDGQAPVEHGVPAAGGCSSTGRGGV